MWPRIWRRFAGQQQRVAARWLRARAAIACAVGRDAPSERAKLLAEARRMARSLEKEGASWAAALGRSVLAGAASAGGNDEQALALLGQAETLLEAAQLESVWAAVRMARGRLVGGDSGRALMEGAAEWMAQQRLSEAGNWAQLPIGKLLR